MGLGDAMEHVLRAIGISTILVGLAAGVSVASQLQQAGVPLEKMLVTSAITGALGIVVVGILFVAFGTVIALLRHIKINTDRGGGL